MFGVFITLLKELMTTLQRPVSINIERLTAL